ncbi:MAG: NFACT RNA binding domain-containing protein [bacterium]|nr:NFACT RNA binding domain-containing protein [bacterium]
MYLDSFTLSALTDEFLDTLVGGRVQDSIDVDDDSIGLEIYADHRRQYLLMAADNRQPRLLVMPDKLRRGVQKPSQLGLLFRRYVEGGRVEHVQQPAWERIIEIEVDGPEGMVTIVVEPMERRANVLLLQEGIILDCMRRVGPDENRYRVSLPGKPYTPPPPQTGKLNPLRVTLEDMIGVFTHNDDPKRKTHQLLTARFLGISPLLGREIVYRAVGESEQKVSAADPAATLRGLEDVIAPMGKRQWQPGVVEADGGVTAFSVYPLRHLPGWEPVETLSMALSRFYSAPGGEDAYNAGKNLVRVEVDEAKAKLGARLASLRRSMTDDSEREALRQSGELILAYQYALQPEQTELRAQYDPELPELVIKLDPTLTALENAQRYFDKYNRAKRALDDVPRLIAETETEIALVAQLETDLDLAANWGEIDEVQQALQGAGLWRGKPTAKISGASKSAPMRLVTNEGWVIWVGRNSRQNEIVTFDKASQNDTWLHARGVPGAHVVIKNEGRTIPEALLDKAAALAAYYSANRAEGRVIVDVTERRHVRKIRGAAAGMVTYRNEVTRTVEPQHEKALGLK